MRGIHTRECAVQIRLKWEAIEKCMGLPNVDPPFLKETLFLSLPYIRFYMYIENRSWSLQVFTV